MMRILLLLILCVHGATGTAEGIVCYYETITHLDKLKVEVISHIYPHDSSTLMAYSSPVLYYASNERFHGGI